MKASEAKNGKQTEETGFPPVFSASCFDFRENGSTYAALLPLSVSFDMDGIPSAHDVCQVSDTLRFRVSVPRCLAAENGKMRIQRDGDGAVLRRVLHRIQEEDNDPALEVWEVRLSARSLCGAEDSGLFFYRFEFDTPRGHCFLSKEPDGLDPVLRFRDEEIAAFQLTVTENGYDTPHNVRGGVMYHIFVDRFCRGETIMRERGISIPRRADAVYNEDWYGGIPQHAKVRGGEVANNEFFGGTLWGVVEKLPYLCSLGVNILYLSPIFRAYSNHKYDTGDYERVDPQFGGDEALSALLAEAKKRGMTVICDGVFNHTGDNSRYFNRRGTYPDVGAYQSEDSPYYPWFRFRTYPNDYECWWGVKTLPAVHSESPAVRAYFCGEGGILQKWMRFGVSGWRLDVADELSDAFLEDARARIKREDPDAVLYGEVWEDASHKCAYGQRRKYFRGRQLDSVMNYPFRTAILDFLRSGDASPLAKTTEEIVRHYPDGAVHTLMNLLGTHDTERALTVLSGAEAGERDNDELSSVVLTREQREKGAALLRLAALLQFTLPGIPCIYYGDEAGMEGFHDPFNRRPYPWGREDVGLLAWYRFLGLLRRSHPVFADGAFRVLRAENGVFSFSRSDHAETLVVCVNRGEKPYLCEGTYRELLTGADCPEGRTVLPGGSAVLLKMH